MQFRTAFYAHSILLTHISPNLDLQGRKRNPCFGESESKKTNTACKFHKGTASIFASVLCMAWRDGAPCFDNRSHWEAELSAVRCRILPAKWGDVPGQSLKGRVFGTACTKNNLKSHLAWVLKIIHFSKNKTKKKVWRWGKGLREEVIS